MRRVLPHIRCKDAQLSGRCETATCCTGLHGPYLRLEFWAASQPDPPRRLVPPGQRVHLCELGAKLRSGQHSVKPALYQRMHSRLVDIIQVINHTAVLESHHCVHQRALAAGLRPHDGNHLIRISSILEARLPCKCLHAISVVFCLCIDQLQSRRLCHGCNQFVSQHRSQGAIGGLKPPHVYAPCGLNNLESQSAVTCR